MPFAFRTRTVAAAALLLASAVAVYLLVGDAGAAAVALVGGVAAALLAAGTGEAPEPIAGGASAALPSGPDLAEVLDRIGAPVLVVGGGRVVIANPAARALLGGHIVGEDVRVAIRHPAAAERLAGRGDGGPISLVGLGTLDQRWDMRVDEVAGARVVQLVDQTGSYAAERMRVDFVANASHELRTPLASILGYIETLQDGAADEPAIRARFLQIMGDQARRMQRLVEDLISLSRIEAEKYRLPDQAVDLNTLVEEVCSELLDSRDGRGREVLADLPDDAATVNGDRAQLSQVLHNLVGNAMKYGRPGTPVLLRLLADGAGMWRLSVRDEGEGIAPEHLPRLTERFYRVDAGRSRAIGGTGLGLAIVKHIVERHRGRLDIASTVGVGTVVTMVLPPAKSLSSKRNTNATQPHASGE